MYVLLGLRSYTPCVVSAIWLPYTVLQSKSKSKSKYREMQEPYVFLSILVFMHIFK